MKIIFQCRLFFYSVCLASFDISSCLQVGEIISFLMLFKNHLDNVVFWSPFFRDIQKYYKKTTLYCDRAFNKKACFGDILLLAALKKNVFQSVNNTLLVSIGIKPEIGVLDGVLYSVG